MNSKAFTAADAVVIAALVGFGWLLWDGAARDDVVRQVEVVSTDGTVRYSLGEPRLLQVRGPLGDSMIRFLPDSVAFESSPCPTKLCVRSGALRRGGQFAACLPNRVAVRLLPGASARQDGGGVDAIGR